MGMDVNGLHYNWSGWSYIAGTIRHYAGDYLNNERAMHGFYELEELGLESWDDYDGTCLDAMGHNGGEAWPPHVALTVYELVKPKVADGSLANEMAEAGYEQADINYTVQRVGEFLDAIAERPHCCIFL